MNLKIGDTIYIEGSKCVFCGGGVIINKKVHLGNFLYEVYSIDKHKTYKIFSLLITNNIKRKSLILTEKKYNRIYLK